MGARTFTCIVTTISCVTVACAGGTEPTARSRPSPEPRRARFEVPTEKQPRVASLRQAVRIAGRHVAVPVNLPSPLPRGARLDGRRPLYLADSQGERSADLFLAVPDRGTMLIQWGSAGFDGCGGDTAKPVRIGGDRGLILIHRYKRLINAQIIWPARKGSIEGTYGISGQFRRGRIVALAESMSPARPPRAGGLEGC
jgi:hypothetical protein